eukprot:1289286-Rhodomonas_salina.1
MLLLSRVLLFMGVVISTMMKTTMTIIMPTTMTKATSTNRKTTRKVTVQESGFRNAGGRFECERDAEWQQPLQLGLQPGADSTVPAGVLRNLPGERVTSAASDSTSSSSSLSRRCCCCS